MNSDKVKKGLVHIYTGAGKGKTTAALGLAIRASGHQWCVLIIQFMKGDAGYGELQVIKNLSNIEFIQTGLPNFVQKGNPSEEDIQLAKEGMLKSQQALDSGNYDLVILDEINVALDFGLIQLKDVIRLIQKKPDDVELVLTGRNAHPELVKLADYVSEILNIKHPYQSGNQNRKGIEF